MNEDIELIEQVARDAMKNSEDHLRQELSKIRAGRANPALLDGLQADAYGSMMPLTQLANISAPDARTLVIQPWDKSVMDGIEKAILEANLGMTPQNDGEVIRLNIPMLTEERRKDLVKSIRSFGENAKVSIRNARRDANEEIKKLQKDGLAEDLAKDAETEIQDLTDKFTNKVDDILKAKEEDVMKV